MRQYGNPMSTGGPSHGSGVPVPLTPRPFTGKPRQGWSIPLLNPVPQYTPPPAPKPKPARKPAPLTAKAAYSGNRLTPEQRAEIIERYNRGENRNQIRLAMNLPRSTVDRWAGRDTPEPKPNRTTFR